MKNWLTMAAAAVFAAGVGGTALAQPHEHSDIEITVSAGQLVIPLSGEGHYVFEGMFGEDVLPANVAEDPGFEADDGVLTPGDAISFNILGPLLYWDGTQIAPVPGSHSLEVSKGFDSAIVDGGSGLVSGFTIATADSEGGMHEHLDYTLNGPGAPGGLTVGAYGVQLQLVSAEYGASNSVIAALNYGLDDEMFEAGVDAFADIVPEPSALALLLIGAAGVLRRR